MKKAVGLLLVRIVVAGFGVVVIFALMNYVSMGIESGEWSETKLKNATLMANGIGMLVSVGSLLTLLGLFRRVGPIVLLVGMLVLSAHFSFKVVLPYVPILILNALLIMWGNGPLSLDAAIRGRK